MMSRMYTKSQYQPSVRSGAAAFALRHGVRLAARHYGVVPGTISKWVKRAKVEGVQPLPTRSSRPRSSPRALARETVAAIVAERQGRRRCAEVVHQALLRKGVRVSLSSVKRILDRCGLRKKRSPWKRPHDFTPRPVPSQPGALIQVDTVHILAPDGSRIYIYTLIDLYSRWAYAEVVGAINAVASVAFVRRASRVAPFPFGLVQTDHGPEFRTWFTHCLQSWGLGHRHCRVRQANDNAHVERFNRTIQEECLDRTVHTIPAFRQALSEYLPYYNGERLHIGLGYRTPLECFQGLELN